MEQEFAPEISKKKKKRSKTILLTDYECLSEELVLSTLEQMSDRLKIVFRSHIGKENSITPMELFTKIYGVNPMELDVFKRNYWWNVLKAVLKNMKRNNMIFVINKGRKLFVLHSYEEAREYEQKVDRDIKSLKENKKKAYEWVRHESWKEI
jgi:hypothetical protein